MDLLFVVKFHTCSLHKISDKFYFIIYLLLYVLHYWVICGKRELLIWLSIIMSQMFQYLAK